MNSLKKNKIEMKKNLLFFLILTSCSITFAQNKANELSNIKAIRSVEDLFNENFSTAATGCSISQHGDVIEWDSTLCVRVSYNLTNIDFDKAIVSDIPESTNAAIYVSCKRSEKCITVYNTATKKTRSYRDAEIFVLPSEKKTSLNDILSRLKTLQQTFKHQN